MPIIPNWLRKYNWDVPYKVAVDFDGTIYDESEEDGQVPGAIKWLKHLQEAGAILALHSCRAGQEHLQWCHDRGIDIIIEDRPKPFANAYIDDLGYGCPKVIGAGGFPLVDWETIGPVLLGQCKMWNSANKKDINEVYLLLSSHP